MPDSIQMPDGEVEGASEILRVRFWIDYQWKQNFEEENTFGPTSYTQLI